MPIEIDVLGSISDIPAKDWDDLAPDDNPFLEHAFLAALEESESVSPDAGCVPKFVIAREHGRLIGAVPLYLKSHSYGEYIFDWAWAEGAQRAGIRYYPKLVAAVPFTPATGHRLLIANAVDRMAVREALLRGVRALADRLSVSSVHFLFCTEDEKRFLEGQGYAPRLSLQFLWENRQGSPYASFDEYLDAFKSRHRKQVRKERQAVAAHGLTFRTAVGTDLDDEAWEALKRFYSVNVLRHRGIEYLQPAFFDILRRTFGHRLVATLAYREGQPVAGTINFEKGKHLYGRYWGCLEQFELLHFELCYYRLIERAIERGYTRFEAGAQGEHKLKRGLLPAYTHSAHYIRHPKLSEAVDEFLRRETEAIKEQQALYNDQSPFRE